MSDFFNLDLADDYEEVETQGDSDEGFSEAERRLSLARYYQQLTKGGLIDEDSEEARQVDEEVRQFARERMNVLIGLAAEKLPAAELPFSEAQVSALQQWADHMIERAAQPAIRPLQPPSPVAKPQPAGPRIKPVAAPPKRKPMTKVVGKKTPVKKTEAANESAKEGADKYADIATGQVFEENGKKYKMVDVPGRVDENGQQKRAKMDVTEQVRPPGAIPMPRREHMALVTGQQAQDTVDLSVGSSAVAQTAAALAILE